MNASRNVTVTLLGAALAVAVSFTACSDDDVKKKADLSTQDTSTSPDLTADTTAADQTLSDQTLSDQTLSDQTLSDQTLSDQTLSDQTLDLTQDKSTGDASKGCGSITDTGCCDGTSVKYCDKGVLKSLDCSSNPKCGWDSTYDYYDCGTSGGSDPKGKYSKTCGVKPLDMGALPDKGPSDAGSSGACGGITYEGCCDGNTLKYCDAGKVVVSSCASSPKCGWDSTLLLYDCGTSGAKDPSGKYPMTCKGLSDGGAKDSGPSPDASTSDAGVKDSGPVPDGASTGTVVITEMMINPKAVTDTKGEWFELYNAGTAAVNLHGWTITDQAGSSQNKHTISGSGGTLMLQPGKYMVLGKNMDSKTNGGVTVAYSYGKSTWDLGNSGDEIYLHDAAQKLVDKVVYTTSWTVPNGATLSLKDPSLDNSVSKNWCAETTKWCATCDMGSPGVKAVCK